MSVCQSCDGKGGRWNEVMGMRDLCPGCDGTGYLTDTPASVVVGASRGLRPLAPEEQDPYALLPCPFCGAYESGPPGHSIAHHDRCWILMVETGARHEPWITDAWNSRVYDPQQRRGPNPYTASVEAGPSRGADAPLTPEGIATLIAAARAWRKDAAAMDAWADGGDGDTPDWNLARVKERALFAAVDALDATPAPTASVEAGPSRGADAPLAPEVTR